MIDFIRERVVYETSLVLPEPPPANQILNYGLKKADQKFPVIRPPKNYKAGSDPEFETQQWHYRLNGMWFYNNGNIEYITGPHWFYLTHWFIDIGLPRFIDADRDWFYWWWSVENTRKLFGGASVENRRAGKTERANCVMYEKISRNFNANGGIQSKSNEDAKKVFSKLVRSWRKMAIYFKPVDIGISIPKTELVFDQPSKTDTKSDSKVYRDVLMSKISFENTKEEAYDGDKLLQHTLDEYGKNVEANVVETVRIVKECLMEEGMPKGKLLAITTIEEMEKKGGANAKILIDDSEADPDAVYGSKSGLSRYFKPCYYGYSGEAPDTKVKFVDDYGYSNIEAAKAFFLRKRKSLEKDINAYRAEVQKYPFTIDEAFYVVNDGSVLNLFNIGDQITYNESSPLPLCTEGDLGWKDGKVDSEVVFLPRPGGKFTFSSVPKKPNQHTFFKGKKAPADGHMGSNGVIGIDPVQRTKAFSARKSDMAAVGFRFLELGNEFSDIPFVSYCGRTPTNYEMFEDMIMLCVFCGMPANIERNKGDLIIHFENRGYANYLCARPSFTMSQDSENKKDNAPGIPNVDDPFRNMLVSQLIDYIETRCGYQNVFRDGIEVRVMSKFYLTDILKSLQPFVPTEKWTPYDLPVAFMYALIMRVKFIAPKVEKKKVAFSFARYQVKGTRSVKIK